MPEPGTPSKSSGSIRPVRAGSVRSQPTPNPPPSEEIEVVFIDSLDKKYECPVCSQVLRYPVQFKDCGHRCCSACLPDLLRVAPRCPICQLVIDKEAVFADKAFQVETDNLGVKCSFFARGCNWTGVLMELAAHIEGCDRMMMTCTLRCGVEFEKRFLQKHLDDDCPKREVHCQFCELGMLAEDEPEHLEHCPKFPVPCPNKCKVKEIAREKLAAHLENDCGMQDLACPFSKFGCEFLGKKKQLKDHLTQKQLSHMDLLCAAVKNGETKRNSQEEHICDLEKKMLGIERRLQGVENLYGPQMLWKIDNYEEKLNEAKSGKKSTIFSPPFLSHRHGYKLALSACLYGDGKFRGQYMSVFVCICKSENDSLLQWPFCHKVTLSLVDQCEDVRARKNIAHQLKPNIVKENRPFLGRPLGERNASFGAPKFAELEIVNTLDYIHDDAIFIKVNIDCQDLAPI